MWERHDTVNCLTTGRLCEELAALARSLRDHAVAIDHIAEARAKAAVRRITRLTAQQYRIAQLASAGLLNKQIAGELQISERTVKAHLYYMYKMLGINKREDLKRLIVEAQGEQA